MYITTKHKGINITHNIRVATVREENYGIQIFFLGQEKVREFHFQSGKFRKKCKKGHGKVREFQNFPKKLLVNGLFGNFIFP